jgi:hypothetical protein
MAIINDVYCIYRLRNRFSFIIKLIIKEVVKYIILIHMYYVIKYLFLNQFIRNIKFLSNVFERDFKKLQDNRSFLFIKSAVL